MRLSSAPPHFPYEASRSSGKVLTFWGEAERRYLAHSGGFYLRTLGGTPNRDPCSLWGVIWGVPRDIGGM